MPSTSGMEEEVVDLDGSQMATGVCRGGQRATSDAGRDSGPRVHIHPSVAMHGHERGYEHGTVEKRRTLTLFGRRRGQVMARRLNTLGSALA